MEGRPLMITVVVVAATILSAYLGTSAIVGTLATLRESASAAQAAPGDIESTGDQVVALLGGLGAPDTGAFDDLRDPMVPYQKPRPVARPAAPAQPRRPSYEVAAVILDESDPTAIVLEGGRSIIVREGDRLNGGRVTKIEADGVTVEDESGSVKYRYSPD